FGSLDNSGDDCATRQVAAVEQIFPAAAVSNLQELIFRNTSIVCVREQLRKFQLGFGQRQRVAQIDFVNALRGGLIRANDLNLAIDSTGPQDGWIDQVRAIGGQNDNHIL